jgi:hypothetical protein
MIKYIILSLIVMYIYNTYIAPLSYNVLQKKHQSRMQDQAKKEFDASTQRNNKVGDFIDYEEVKD